MITSGSVSAGFWRVAMCAMLASAAAAQVPDGEEAGEAQGTPAISFPCEHEERFRQFDFWVGEWDVHTADGTLAGKNVITTEQHGCVLVENWTGAGGGTGMSMNYLDKATDEWVQVWTDASGSQINIRGGLTDSGMLLTGQIHYVGNGTTAPFRGLWTPQPDGRVRQFFEQSNDGGETWQPWFEGYYSPAGQADAGTATNAQDTQD